MNKKININPSSTKWLEKDDRVVADYFCDLGFRSLKQILDMRVFDLMNMQGLNAVRVEEVIICLYKWLNPNTAIDEAIYNGMMSQPFLYTPWRKEHKDLAAIKVGDLVLTPGINMKAIQHFYDAIRKAFFKSEEYNWRWYKFRNRSEYDTALQLTGFDPVMASIRHYDFADAAKDTPFYKEIIPAMLDYFETEHYVFTHGWIPSIPNRDKSYSYISSWREADREQWNRARWFNGMDAVQTADENKTIVCGHWHTSYGHSKYEHKGTEFGEDADFSPYYGPGIIAIDACTAFSGKVNCLVIED